RADAGRLALPVVVEDLPQQVTVPPDQVVGGRDAGADQLAVGRVQTAGRAVELAVDRPRLGTRVPGVDVGGRAATGVPAGPHAPEHFAGGGVVHLVPARAVAALVDAEDL